MQVASAAAAGHASVGAPPLKRCRSDSAASSSSSSSSSPAASAAALASARRKDDKCVDGWHGATECSRLTSSSLTMKDLLNDASSQDTEDDDTAAANGELPPRITVEKLEIHEMSACRLMDDAAAMAPSPLKAEKEEASERTTEEKSADEALDLKCKRLAELIAGSKHLVAFTGAGISTSVGLPDYRGDNGIRTKGYEKQKQQSKRRKVTSDPSPSSSDNENGKQQPAIPDFNQLVPSKTHMALFELHRLGYLKHLVSQNVDNLHLKSGIPVTALTEVHGNATQAKCETCEKIYTQDFPWTGLCDDPACVSTKRSVEQRLRARTRHGNGRLKRNVISFDEPMGDIDNAIDECEAADVALVLGTSLRVEPFSEMAGEFAESLVIVNLQSTTQKLDKRAESSGVRLFEKCDLVMEKTMKFLLGEGYEIPAWSGEHATSVFIPEHEEKNLVNVLAGRLLA